MSVLCVYFVQSCVMIPQSCIALGIYLTVDCFVDALCREW